MKKQTRHALAITGLCSVILLSGLYCAVSISKLEGHRFGWGSKGHHLHQKLGVNDVQNIQGWMTFDYINYVFNLPPQYLEQKLSLSDQKYPNISINHYAEAHNMTAVLFLQNVKGALNSYFHP